VRKAIVFSSHDLALLYKDNFGKNHNRKTKKKTKWGKIAAIHSILKKKNYKTKFSTRSITKKKSTNIIFLKIITKQKHKKNKKNHVGNTVVIHSVL
jgi:hypothetical protein